MHVARLLAIAALLVGSGCSKGAAHATVTCEPPECQYRTALPLVAEVTAPSMGPYVNQEFPSLTIDPVTGTFTLRLAAPVMLKGTVKLTSTGTDRPVSAAIVATRASRISGRPAIYYQTATDPATGAYQLLVSPNLGGEQYTLRVTPNDPSLVPPMEQLVTATADQQLDIAYADPLILPELHGKVTDSLQTGVAGMKVQASDPASGSVVSTTVVTDATGAFSLRLLPSRPPTVKLTATQAPVAMPPGIPAPPPMPTLLRLAKLPDGMVGLSVEANLQLPALPAAAHINYVVSSPSLSGAMTPVVGATCVFSADVSDPNSVDGVTAIFSTTTITDAKGYASVYLVPAPSGNRSYDVRITPDPSSSFQATTTTVKVAPGGGYTQIMGLAIRPQLYGRVLDPTNAPLAGATIAPMPATLAPPLTPQPSALRAPTLPAAASATAADDGLFSLRLDPSVWDVALIPPASSKLPRLWVAGTNVISDTNLGDITIPRGVKVRGLVVDAHNQPVAVADVLLFTVAQGNANCAATDLSCLAPARLRAEGPTDTTGTVAMILPNKPVD